MARRTKKGPKQVETLTHDEARRKNIPTAELQSAAQRAEEANPFEPVTYMRNDPLPGGETRPRDPDLDPQIVWKGTTLRLTPEQIERLTETGKLEIGDAQLVWRGKDQQDWSDLVVQAPPLYIQEKVHPKAIIEDLKRQTKERQDAQSDTLDLFGDFNGIDPEAKTDFYQHDQNWQNRMILGDSLQVMASLAEREGLRGQVQCIYFDPPYGIRFRSNWQVSTRDKGMSDQDKLVEMTREPEQVQAFRDTWRDGIHSYMTYLRDRFTAMRDLLTESGSIFVQISDENVHRVRCLLDEVFGDSNFICEIIFRKTGGESSSFLGTTSDYILWYGKKKANTKYRQLYRQKVPGEPGAIEFTNLELPNGDIRKLSNEELANPKLIPKGAKVFATWPIVSPGYSEENSKPIPVKHHGEDLVLECPQNVHWKVGVNGVKKLWKFGRLLPKTGQRIYKRYLDDFPYTPLINQWNDSRGEVNSVYVVQTATKIVERCILMTTDPGDLVFDPTCGSGTTAFASEQWGRRWVTVDTSRVALALSRARIMGAQFPYFLLKDSKDGQLKLAELERRAPSDQKSYGDVRLGFVCKRSAHITQSTITNNAELDVIWDEYRERIGGTLNDLNDEIGQSLLEWEIPNLPDEDWSQAAKKLHFKWLSLIEARDEEMGNSIASKANYVEIVDQPYEKSSTVRVAGPFTVESLSPHRVVSSQDAVSEIATGNTGREKEETALNDFTQMVIDNLKSAGVHQASKDDRIEFTTIDGWPGSYIAAEGHFLENETERRAAIFIGPEFGTVTRADLTAAAREALDARFDALIACGFNFEAHTSELTKLGPLPVLKAKMNPDLHMSEELKNTGAGNLFVVFGEPDIEWDFDDDGNIVVEVLGVDVFDPKTGDVRASGKDDIAAWFIDTDYDEESFFVRHAYFMGANDPYKSLKTSLKSEIDKEAWETLYRDTSRPFPRPTSGRFAVKVINHFGDEVMKVFGV